MAASAAAAATWPAVRWLELVAVAWRSGSVERFRGSGAVGRRRDFEREVAGHSLGPVAVAPKRILENSRPRPVVG